MLRPSALTPADGEDSRRATLNSRSGVHPNPPLPIVLVPEAAGSWGAQCAGMP